MHLVPGFHLRTVGTEYLAVPSGAAAARFNGLLMLNETGAFLVRALDREIGWDELLARLREEYDAPDELLAADLDRFLAQMREQGLLEEDGP